MTHFLHSDDGLILKYGTVVRPDAFVVENIIARNYRHDAGNFECFGSIDMLDARMRHRTAQNFSVAHAGNTYIRQVLRPAGHLGLIIQTAKCFADIC